MDSKKLQMLVTTIDLGSFTKASEVVGYTQSGLTHMMDSLENEIGFPITVRGHGGVSLNENGEILMPLVREFLSCSARLEDAISKISQQRLGTIRIAAYASMAMHWMPQILYSFRRVCPDVAVELRMVDHALEPFELLSNGNADLIFASKQDQMDCEWIPLYNELLYAVLPSDYPVEGRTQFPISEFAGKDFIMPYGRFDIEVEKAFEKSGIKVNSNSSKVDDETVIRMVEHGLGVSMMSELMIRGRTNNAICLPITPQSYRELGMGLRHERRNDISIRNFIDCVKAMIK